MEFTFDDYIAGIIESRKTDRERNLDGEIQRITKKHLDAMVVECKPIYKELADIKATQPPLPGRFSPVSDEAR